MEDCIFCKIARGELPCRKVYEDDEVLAFHDIQPVAPVHFMLIPKRHATSLAHVDDSYQGVLGKIMVLAHRLAEQEGATDGFRLIVNTGRVARQDVPHVHVHVIGGPDVLPHMLHRPKAGAE